MLSGCLVLEAQGARSDAMQHTVKRLRAERTLRVGLAALAALPQLS